jgi:hypothetical protein
MKKKKKKKNIKHIQKITKSIQFNLKKKKKKSFSRNNNQMCPLTRNNLVRVETPSPLQIYRLQWKKNQLQYYESLGTHVSSSNEDTDTEDELFFSDFEEEEEEEEEYEERGEEYKLTERWKEEDVDGSVNN